MSCFGGSRPRAKSCFSKEDISAPVNPLAIAQKGLQIKSMPVSDKNFLGDGAEVIRRKPNYFAKPGEVFDEPEENVYNETDDPQSPVSRPATPPPLPRRKENRNPPLTNDGGSLPNNISVNASDLLVQRSGKVTTLLPDDFFGNHKVLSLDNVTMKDYIQQSNTVFVMFYKPDNKACVLSKNMYSEAANRDGVTSYTAVNCTKESVLCRLQDVKTLPVVKLFNNGALVNTFGLKELAENRLPMYSSAAPTIQEVPSPKRPCAVDEHADDENIYFTLQ